MDESDMFVSTYNHQRNQRCFGQGETQKHCYEETAKNGLPIFRKFPTLREVLRSHENNAYTGILERLDAIAPDPEGEVLVKQSLKLRVKFYLSYLSVWLALPMAQQYSVKT